MLAQQRWQLPGSGAPIRKCGMLICAECRGRTSGRQSKSGWSFNPNNRFTTCCTNIRNSRSKRTCPVNRYAFQLPTKLMPDIARYCSRCFLVVILLSLMTPFAPAQEAGKGHTDLRNAFEKAYGIPKESFGKNPASPPKSSPASSESLLGDQARPDSAGLAGKGYSAPAGALTTPPNIPGSAELVASVRRVRDAQKEQTPPIQPLPDQTQSIQPEPDQIHPDQVQPGQFQPSQFQPSQFQPNLNEHPVEQAASQPAPAIPQIAPPTEPDFEELFIETAPPVQADDPGSSANDLGAQAVDPTLQVVVQDEHTMWWQPLVVNPLDQRDSQQVSPEMLIHLALANSPKILATSLRPLIQHTEIGESIAEFDPELFVQTQFDDRVDPVGNQLTTGNGIPFLKDHIWYGEAGFRRKLKRGGDFGIKQRLGFQNSNSRFFDPADQGTATLSLNYSQPLLRGRGLAYNRSQIVIAQIGHQASWDQYGAELQNELTKVVEAYWNLYYNRAVLVQKQHNVERGVAILQKLVGRSGLDTLPSQIARARAAVESRRTELANAHRDVKNAETEIRRLIGSADNFQAIATELLPMESPVLLHANESLEAIIQHAIQMRPEVKQAMQRSRIAAVQQHISEHELLPELNLIFSSYVSALRGESQVLEAWSDQFTNATPGYAVGLEYNIPRGRRAEKARLNRQQLVLQQVRHEIDQAVNEVVAETQIAWRQVDSAFQTTLAAAESIKAARADLAQNEARWESFALVEGDLTEGQTPTTLLDQLLDAQQRLTNSELTYSQALRELKVAEIGLKRASGRLLVRYELPAEFLQTAPVSPAIQDAGDPGQPR